MSKPRSERHLAMLLVRLIMVMAAILPLGLVHAQPARASGLCSLDPDPVSRKICEAGGGGLLTIPGIPNPAKLITNDVVMPILQQFTQAEATAVGSVLQKEMNYVNSGTTPALSEEWFLTEYAVLFAMAIFIAIGLFATRTTLAVKNQDGADAVKAFGLIILFVIGGGIIPLMVGATVKVTDGPITQAWLNDAGGSLQQSLKHLVDQLSKTQNFGDAVLLPLIVLFIGVLSGVVTILELFFREGAIYVFTAASVIALALFVGGRITAELCKRVFFGLIGLILLKPIMAILLTFGVKMFGSQGQGSDPIILGSVMCLVVPVLSWAAYKAISGHDAKPSKWASKATAATRAAIAVLA